MQLIKNSTFSLRVILVSIITFGCIIQSCQMEDDSLKLNEYSAYLDATSNYDNLTNSDFYILRDALKRVEPYILESAGRLRLNISSGKTINISDNLFEMVVKTLNKSNVLIQDGQLFINENKLIPFKHNLSKTPRLKSGHEDGGDPYEDPTQTEYYYWGNVQTTNLNQQGAYDYYHNFENAGKIESTIAGLITGFLSYPVGFAITIGGFVVSYTQGNALYNAAKSGGIKITTTSIYGLDGTTYGEGRTTIINDSNGNTILIH